MKHIFSALALCAAFPAFGQSVTDCDWKASAMAITEPWEENSRTFSNGQTRLALIDTIEPAAVPFHLLILSPPYDEVGGRQCQIVSANEETGFYGLAFEQIEASYDPAVGLIFDLPVQLYLPDGDVMGRRLHITLNQATGEIRASLP